MKDRRVLIPIVAGIIIAVVSTWRVMTNKPQDYAAQVKAAVIMRPVSGFRGDFEALDSDNRLVRLGGFLGRHRVIVLFFDGEVGADKDTELLRLRNRFAELNAHDVKIIAVSAALPQENRAAMTAERAGPFPFPLVSDFDPTSPEGALRIHRRWGRIDAQTGKPLTGAFAIDRKGQVLFAGDSPKPMENVDRAVESSIR
ncbi:MAG: redoxin domain-containing protein [Candidatus Saccharimonas sp.]|nr:redoxin domain-containing protein [Planctomycetaceae bacterium]